MLVRLAYVMMQATILMSQLVNMVNWIILQLTLMPCCQNQLRQGSHAFFLNCALEAPNCQQRYVIQESLLCPLTTSTIGIRLAANWFSWIFHNHMLGDS